MPKSRKKKNADFQKVKLKVGKQKRSETDTVISLKTRTIQVTQSWKNLSSASQQPHTKGKLTLEDLLRRCDPNKSCSQRLSAVEGFKELVLEVGSGVLLSYMDKIMVKVAVLLCDPEHIVRQAVVKLCKSAFPLLCGQDCGFFDTVSTHLCLAMSHISDEVRHDALLLFDLLLETFPHRVIGGHCRLVPSLIDQINTHMLTGTSKNRRVAFTLGNVLSSQQWRMQVLQRLKMVVDTYVAKHREDTTLVHCQPDVHHVLRDYPAIRGPIVLSAYKLLWATRSRHSLSEPEQEYTYLTREVDKLSQFISSVLPLVKQCWLEQFCSQSTGAGQADTSGGPALTEDSLPMLRTGLGVLHSFVQCWYCWYTYHKRPFVADCWFREVFLVELRDLLLPVFPIVVMERSKKGRAGKMANTAVEGTVQTGLTAVQTQVLKLNLAVCEILASFPSSEGDAAVIEAPSEHWHKVIVNFLLKNLKLCTGPEFSQQVTTVLNRIFYHFPHTEKQDKLLAKVVKQFTRAHPLSADKKAYLALLDDLAFSADYSSPYHAGRGQAGRHDSLRGYFEALVQLLLQLRAVEGAGNIAELVTEVIGHAYSVVLLEVIRNNMKEFLDEDKCVFTTLPKSCQARVVQAIALSYRHAPVPEDILQMVEAVVRLPAVDMDVARQLVMGLNRKFCELIKDASRKDLPNKQDIENSRMVYTRFLFSLLVGHKRTELEAVHADHSWETGGLTRVLWTGSKDSLHRHHHILQHCCRYFPDYLESSPPVVPYGSAVVEIMGQIWTQKILTKYCTLTVYTVYGALYHWLRMMDYMSDADIYHVDDAAVPPTVPQENQEYWSHCRDVRLSQFKSQLRPFTRLTFSLLYSMVAMETGEGEAMADREMVGMMWDLVMTLMNRSLLMMLDLIKVMTDFVQGERKEQECLRAVLVMTRLMTDDQLDRLRRVHRNLIDPQLTQFMTTVQTASPGVDSCPGWQDFRAAVSALAGQSVPSCVPVNV